MIGHTTKQPNKQADRNYYFIIYKIRRRWFFRELLIKLDIYLVKVSFKL